MVLSRVINTYFVGPLVPCFGFWMTLLLPIAFKTRVDSSSPILLSVRNDLQRDLRLPEPGITVLKLNNAKKKYLRNG